MITNQDFHFSRFIWFEDIMNSMQYSSTLVINNSICIDDNVN